MSKSVMEREKKFRLIRQDSRSESKSRSLKHAVLWSYRDLPLSTRLFLKLRWRFTPYEEIAAYAPTRGLIYDLGCGHGLLSLTLALQSPARIVRAIDHDERRIRLARKTARNFLNVEFCDGDFTEVLDRKKNHATAIVVMDAMHYLSPQDQERLLEQARTALLPGGLFLMREVDTTAGLTSWINKVHEWGMTATRFTRAERVSYRTPEEWENLFRKSGFCVESKPCGCFPFADRLFIGQKT